MIVEQVREAVRAGGLLWDARPPIPPPARPPEGDEILARPAQPVIAMVSGGRDSTCLVDVAVALCAPGSVMALHVNYELRGAESDSDERHCRALCESLGVELEIVHARRPKGEAGNLQAWARDVRYKAAMRMTERENALLAAGHTATDQVETVLYRLAASPGRRALLGMSAREGRLVRPLLGMTRAQTAAYCRERGLQWREDASNVSDTYARGRVRHGLMAALGAVHPAAEANVLRTAQLLREETELLEGLVEGVLEGGRSVAIERLEELPVALGRLVVISLAEQAAGTYVPQAGDRVGEILELARRGGRLDLHVGGNVSARIEGGTLSMVKLPPR